MPKKTRIPQVFSEEHFVATSCSTAKDKAEFANYFVHFVLEQFSENLFTEKFYRRLMNTRGHIAHYNRSGFYDNWFASPEDKLRFLEHWINNPIFGDPKFTYSDVERALQKWLREHHAYEVQQSRSERERERIREAEEQEVIRLRALAGKSHQKFKVADKSKNIGPFGHYRYLMVAEDGSAWIVSRTLCYPWVAGEVVEVPLSRDGLPQWHMVSCEVPTRVVNADEKVIDDLWGVKV